MIGLLNNLNLNIMLKNILKLEGVQELNKTEQKNIAGSGSICRWASDIFGNGIGRWVCFRH
jgi:hypothetical protein